MSGGIDSALVAAVAVEALGRENVQGIGMPSEFSSSGSVADAESLARNLGIAFTVLPIREVYDQFVGLLAPFFAGSVFGLAEENVQPRIRGTLLMAVSNKTGGLVLTTGNKSEMATGYSTLYGDMVGALAVIGDLYKTEVYALSRWLNRNGEVIPEDTITKPPSAELRHGQKDTDSLPEYEVLDPMLRAYVEEYQSAAEIAKAQDVPLELVRKVIRLVEIAEYKRQQAASVRGLAPGARAAAGAQALPNGPKQMFPPVDPKNFTAPSPSVDTVNQFLHVLWGYDENRVWSVASIMPTPAPGVVAVRLYVGDSRDPGRVAQTTLFVTPDGKHAIAGEVVSFGTQPFAETRATLQQRADGPARGASGKELEIVEFANLQCAACSTAQTAMDQMLQDFPQARFVYEDVPEPKNALSARAAAVGHCVRQAKGDAAFYTYAKAVYAAQADLTPDKADATLRTAASAAGADPGAVMTCAATPSTQAAVDAATKLARDIGVTSEPTLVINGRITPVGQVPYDRLAKVVVFQGSLDGVTVQQNPRLSTLK